MRQALDSNTPFIRYYKKLDEQFTDIDACFDFYINEHITSIREKIILKHSSDPNGILGTYFRINPNLESPIFYRDSSCQEIDRITITRYRVGSHKLEIQTGRQRNINATDRLCKCGTGVQNIDHVLFRCPLTQIIRTTHRIQINDNLYKFFDNNDYIKISSILKAIEEALK